MRCLTNPDWEYMDGHEKGFLKIGEGTDVAKYAKVTVVVVELVFFFVCVQNKNIINIKRVTHFSKTQYILQVLHWHQSYSIYVVINKNYIISPAGLDVTSRPGLNG